MDTRRLSAIIASAQGGSTEGFEALLDAYGHRLYGYFLRATGSHHDAEDLLSDIAMKLVKTLKNYDERGRFEPWLFRVAANMVRDRIRRSKAAVGTVSLWQETDGGSQLADQIGDDGPRADAGLLADEALGQLEAAMHKLDATTRGMISLRHFGELSFKEIAQTYGCPLGTVLARVHRGLAALRRLMGADNGTE